ncbi:hypothetical protein N9C06_06575 [Salibacteraceae bacterium]|jgi:hypothetical protein|nr:hypothetical protein [Salibacteraceae bacterium]
MIIRERFAFIWGYSLAIRKQHEYRNKYGEDFMPKLYESFVDSFGNHCNEGLMLFWGTVGLQFGANLKESPNEIKLT